MSFGIKRDDGLRKSGMGSDVFNGRRSVFRTKKEYRNERDAFGDMKVFIQEY